ncbi:hypothetical protein SELMODRAFT_422018 [Selaginella moellendorffii]|uniref:SET domain-containing protein n=1 Tax=Selaginella moellendorffii TaxID=88036 RepID=D8SH30_SELML|nr:hypothetical protein SELMODRAFT_422018 [Selaginella moellendorffii]
MELLLALRENARHCLSGMWRLASAASYRVTDATMELMGLPQIAELGKGPAGMPRGSSVGEIGKDSDSGFQEKLVRGRIIDSIRCVEGGDSSKKFSWIFSGRPIHRNTAVFALEDERGMASCVMVPFALLPEEDVTRVFPRGAEVVIKDPSSRMISMMQVRSPSLVEVVAYFPELRASRDAAWLRELGDKEVERKNFRAAIELYSNSIGVFCQAAQGQGSALALSSRAEAWLLLKHYDRAFADADAALACCESFHAASWLTKAQALTGLHHYSIVFDVLKQAMELSPDSAEITKAYQESLIRKEQSENGAFDLPRLLGQEGDHSMADFVGPLELAPSRVDSDGIGLFVTRDAKRGELLLVSNPSWDNLHLTREWGDKITMLVRACAGSSRTRSRMVAMGEEVARIDAFRPNSRIKVTEELQISLIEEVAHNHADCTLPFCINHSCTPNVYWCHRGGIILVLASRDLEAGEELLKSYYNCSLRLGSCLSIGLHCERCLLQSRPPLDGIAARYQAEDRSEEGGGANFKLVELVSELEREMRKMELSGEETMRLRCAYFRGYATYYARWKSHGRDELPEMPEPVLVFEAMHRFASGDGNALRVMFGLHSLIHGELSPHDDERVRQWMLELSVSSAGSAWEAAWESVVARRDECEKLCLSGVPAPPWENLRR